MRIVKILKGLKQKWIKNSQVLESKKLCGVPLKTIKGTIRNNADQDDAWFFQLAKRHEVIVDIGANVGYTALLALLQNADKRYVLVDPNPLALADASKNLILNGLGKNASIFQAFVGDKKGEKVKFYTVGSGAAGSMFKSHATTAAMIDSWFYVETWTLDTIMEYYQIVPTLIKIDVEGAESLVLEGANETTLRYKPTYFVEMHALKEVSMEENAEKILNWCDNSSYSAWYMKHARKLTNSNEIAQRGKCHLLLLPSDMNYPSDLKKIKQNAPLQKQL